MRGHNIKVVMDKDFYSCSKYNTSVMAIDVEGDGRFTVFSGDTSTEFQKVSDDKRTSFSLAPWICDHGFIIYKGVKITFTNPALSPCVLEIDDGVNRFSLSEGDSTFILLKFKPDERIFGRDAELGLRVERHPDSENYKEWLITLCGDKNDGH